MSQSPFNDNDLLDLADEFCNGVTDATDLQRLESLLREDSDARKAYLRYMTLHADLLTGGSEADYPQPAKLLAKVFADEGRGGSLHLFDSPAPTDAGASPISSARRSTVQIPRLGKSSHWSQLSPVRLAAALVLLMFGMAIPWILFRPSISGSSVQKSPLQVGWLTSSRDCRWSSGSSAFKPGSTIFANQKFHLLEGHAEITLMSGATTMLTGPAEFAVETAMSAHLRSGSVSTRVPAEAHGFTINTPNVRIVDLGTQFTTLVDEHGETEIEVTEGLVDVRRRAPRHYWNFDEPKLPYRDRLTGSPAILGSQANPAKGLVGSGAVQLNNQLGSVVFVGNGSVPSPEQNGFVARNGITLEAFFISYWTGTERDYDHFFRKEDDDYRVLLAFQGLPGGRGAVSMPPVPDGPCLSFGIFLEGQGYHELDMPLDGKEGRPLLQELTDGKPHHVVATYDAATGAKRFYIDGKNCMTMNYPPGTQLVSGGHAAATIGGCAKHVDESFRGIIDEVAWYDFALDDKEVARHFQSAKEGKNYFGENPSQAMPTNQTVRLKEGQTMRFNAANGFPADPSTE